MSTAPSSSSAGKTAHSTTAGHTATNAPKAARPAKQAQKKPVRPAGKLSTPQPAASPAAAAPAARPAASKPVTSRTVASKAAESRPVKAAPVKTERKKTKADKPKVVRDSFTIPKTEYAQLAELKKRGVKLGLEVKKSELLRAGLLLLSASSDAAFRKAMAQVPTLKTGRPGKD